MHENQDAQGGQRWPPCCSLLILAVGVQSAMTEKSNEAVSSPNEAVQKRATARKRETPISRVSQKHADMRWRSAERRAIEEKRALLLSRLESSRAALATVPPGGVQALRLTASIEEWEREMEQLPQGGAS